MTTAENFVSPLAHKETTIAKDLNLNLQRLVSDGALSPTEVQLALLATARTVGYEELAEVARVRLQSLGIDPVQITEAEESAAIMGMLNTYYKFRTFIHGVGEEKQQDYRQAGLRMTALGKPALGKESFEMMAFAVSVINGCETCVVSHEKVLRDAGVSVDKIHDLARLASVVKALKTLSQVK